MCAADRRERGREVFRVEPLKFLGLTCALKRTAEIVSSGVQVICLLALSDRGTPS
jgi:hypothetical protein